MPAFAVTPSCGGCSQGTGNSVLQQLLSALLLAALLFDNHIFLSEEDNLDTASHKAQENVQSQQAFPVVLQGFLHINLLLWKS